MGEETRTCAICGCTDNDACHDDLRGACFWVGERLCSHCAQPDPRRAMATVAASQLAAVVDELLRFAREGDLETFSAFALDPAENAAEALRTILRIQAQPGGFIDPKRTPEFDAEASQLIGAIDRFIEGWA